MYAIEACFKFHQNCVQTGSPGGSVDFGTLSIFGNSKRSNKVRNKVSTEFCTFLNVNIKSILQQGRPKKRVISSESQVWDHGVSCDFCRHMLSFLKVPAWVKRVRFFFTNTNGPAIRPKVSRDSRARPARRPARRAAQFTQPIDWTQWHYDVIIRFPFHWVLLNMHSLLSIAQSRSSLHFHIKKKILFTGAPFALRPDLRLPGGGQDPGPVHSLEESSNAANQNQVQRRPRNGGLASGYC